MNPNKNRWLDIQIVLITLAMSATLYLWNLFASREKPVVNNVSPIPTDIPTIANNPYQPNTIILLGAPAPQSQSSADAPEPVTNTSSSRP